MSSAGRLGEPLDPGGDAEQDLVVLGAEGDLTAALPKKSANGRSSAGSGTDGQQPRRSCAGRRAISAGISRSMCRPATAGRSYS